MADFGFSERVPVDDEARGSYLAFAESAVADAGREALPFFRTQLDVENKSADGFDPVTEGDRAVERRLRELIAERFPEHGICGEEFGYQPGSGLTWVIDPIDGTRAFMSGMLHWGVLLALFDGEEPIVGAMCQPYTGEVFAGDGRAAWYEFNGSRRRLSASSCTDLSDAVLATTGTHWFDETDTSRFDRVSERVKLTRIGGDCYLHAMVAMGGVDIGIDGGLNPYDIQALIPIVRGAGGVVSTHDGGNAAMGGFVVCAANPTLHERVLQVIAGG